MRQARIVVAAVGVVFLSSAAGAQQSDEMRLRDLIAAHQAASEHGDLRGLVDIYAPDAEIIAGNGKVIRGRPAIEADYRNTLAGASAKSGRHHTHPADSIRIRFLSPEMALIDVASVNTGGTDAAGAPMPASRAQLLTIWQKRTEGWAVLYQRVVPSPKEQ